MPNASVYFTTVELQQLDEKRGRMARSKFIQKALDFFGGATEGLEEEVKRCKIRLSALEKSLQEDNEIWIDTVTQIKERFEALERDHSHH
tara:strand:+ start:98 stop:367 length:270 start_codon:yes stop_codon:yes gene_type:complete